MTAATEIDAARTAAPGKRLDPRLFQIAGLSMLIAFGVSARAFSIAPDGMATIFATALATQFLMSKIFALRFEWKSACITSLSLTLLLRANELWPLAAAAFIGISSKFLIRLNGKHLFNPANIGIVAMTLIPAGAAGAAAWTTPGQWGTALWFAALIAGAGAVVTYRASRLDVPLIFLGAFAALIFARALWLGDPLAIPLLRLQNGALVLFAFFMVSDPMTTPDDPKWRALFAAGVALLSYVFIYHLFESDGLFYALAIACLIRPAIDVADRTRRFRWSDPPNFATG